MPTRRAVLRGAPGGLLAVTAGCQSAGHALRPSVSLTDHHGGGPVRYAHDRLHLRTSRARIGRGETVAFTVTNVGDERVVLGCGNPWTLHQHHDGRWRDVLWTSADGHPPCATDLQPGQSLVERVTLPESLRERAATVRYPLSPGRYRFVLLGADPFLAVEFRLTAD